MVFPSLYFPTPRFVFSPKKRLFAFTLGALDPGPVLCSLAFLSDLGSTSFLRNNRASRFFLEEQALSPSQKLEASLPFFPLSPLAFAVSFLTSPFFFDHSFGKRKKALPPPSQLPSANSVGGPFFRASFMRRPLF